MSQCNPKNKDQSTHAGLSERGKMGEIVAAIDWSKTALGPIESWPQSVQRERKNKSVAA